MNHTLFVGFFDVTSLFPRPAATKPIEIVPVNAILRKYADTYDDGAPVMALSQVEDLTPSGRWIGQIDREAVFEKSGYLVCPWLGLGFNKRSVRFICELYESLEMRIFEPEDRLYYTPTELDQIESEFFRIRPMKG